MRGGGRYAPLLAVNSIESTMIGEMHGLGAGPSAAERVDRHQRDVRKLLRVLSGDRRIARAIEVLGDYFLPFLGVQIFEVLLRDLAGAVSVDHLVDDTDRRLGEDAHGRGDDFELVQPKFLQREKGLV